MCENLVKLHSMTMPMFSFTHYIMHKMLICSESSPDPTEHHFEDLTHPSKEEVLTGSSEHPLQDLQVDRQVKCNCSGPGITYTPLQRKDQSYMHT